MLIRHIARNAAMAQSMRARIQREGVTCQGHPLWSPKENSTLHSLYPSHRGNRIHLRRALPRRTYAAIKTRARIIGVAKKHPRWTSNEVRTLRALYTRARKSDVTASLPRRTWSQIKSKAGRLKLRRPQPLKILGRPALDAIRLRARSVGLTMFDLDCLARTGHYFRQNYSNDRDQTNGAILRAAKLLGGQIVVRWK